MNQVKMCIFTAFDLALVVGKLWPKSQYLIRCIQAQT